MKRYIQNNLKIMLVVMVLFSCTVAIVGTSELFAKILPDISELKVVEYYVEDNQIFDYTGQAVEPQITKLIFLDSEENSIVKEKDEIKVIGYIDNIEVGNGDIEVSVDGYSGSIILEDAFQIQLAQVKSVQIGAVSIESTELMWEKLIGANGYNIFRSSDAGATYQVLSSVSGNENVRFIDCDIQPNTVYYYKVGAYEQKTGGKFYGVLSDDLKHTTPLEVPVMTSCEGASYDSIKIQWNPVEGAVGYQLYRNTEKQGEYECITEIADGTVSSYTDSTCICGQTYYYYLKALQVVDNQNIYGEASDIVSCRTVPNQIRLSGQTKNGDTEAHLSWGKSDGAQGYQIYRSMGSEADYQLVKIIEGDSVLSWSDTGLDKDSVYYYKIRPYLVFEGETITGPYSGTYMKEKTYVYEALEGNIQGILEYQGVRYVGGGRTPQGWDCSGFTQWALKACFDVSIPKPAALQGNGGRSVDKNDSSSWLPGDILCFSSDGKVTHVALYIGNGQMMHALNEKYGTFIQSVDYYEWWDGSNTLTAVKRYF